VEGEIRVVFGLCLACWWIGWECGMYMFSFLYYSTTPALAIGGYWKALLTRFSVDGYGPQVSHQGLSYADSLLWNCEYCGEWSCYAQVRFSHIWFDFSVKS
jgi:hypothetical protein